MIEQRYSLKSFLRALYNTETYQREIAEGEAWYFTGPLMHRMSAEQIWDSVITLVRGNVDSNVSETNQSLRAYLAALKKLSDTVQEKGLAGLAEVTKKAKAQQEINREKLDKMCAEIYAKGTPTKQDAQALNQAEQLIKTQERNSSMAGILGVQSV
jgi:competence protein ComGC